MARLAEKRGRWLIWSLTFRSLRDVDFTRGKNKVLLQVLPILLFIAVWWIVAVLIDIPRLYPTPLLVGERFVGIIAGKSALGFSYSHIAATFYRLFIAFGLSFVIGVSIGLLIGRTKVFFDLFDNAGWIFLAVPAIIWAFIIVVALGITDVVPVAVLMALLIPNVAFIVAEGAKDTPADILEMADSFKATTWQKVRDVFMPHLLPYLIASARVSFNIGVKIIIVAEIVGLTTGIGFMVKYWDDKVFVAPLVAWGIVLVLLGLIVEYALFDRLERGVAKWRTYGVQTIQERRE